jgi:hypothetical protein
MSPENHRALPPPKSPAELLELLMINHQKGTRK